MTLTKIVDGQTVNLTNEEQSAIEADWAANQAIQDTYVQNFQYLDDRRNAYPPVVESIEAIFEGLKSLEEAGISFPQNTSDWLTSMQNIYDINPAP